MPGVCMHVRQARDIARLGSADVDLDRAAEKDYVGNCGELWDNVVSL